MWGDLSNEAKSQKIHEYKKDLTKREYWETEFQTQVQLKKGMEYLRIQNFGTS